MSVTLDYSRLPKKPYIRPTTPFSSFFSSQSPHLSPKLFRKICLPFKYAPPSQEILSPNTSQNLRANKFARTLKKLVTRRSATPSRSSAFTTSGPKDVV